MKPAEKTKAPRKRSRARTRARALVAREVRRGDRPHPNDVPCEGCGRRWSQGDPPHQHDHHRGYRKGARGDVVVLCQACHAPRSAARRDDCSRCPVCDGPHRKHERRGVPAAGAGPRRVEGRTEC